MIEIVSEKPGERGWGFEAQVISASGTLQKVTLTLSWADYNLWSADGGDRPAALAEAVLAFLVERMGSDDLPFRLDASVARRLYTDADREIPRRIPPPSHSQGE